MKNNFLDTFHQFLKLLNTKITKTSAEEYLERHPDQGSMLAYTDALTHFKIENAAAQITLKDLEDLPTPLITFQKIDGGTFTIIKSVENNLITWLHRDEGWIQTKIEEFAENWSGIVLFAEPDKDSGEQDFTSKRRQEILYNLRMPIAISLLVIILGTFLFTSGVSLWGAQLLLFLKMLGMIVTGLLFIKSVDSNNALVQKVCSSGSKVNCQSLLDSPAAKITSWFSWSDAGFIYFFGSFFGLLMSIGSGNMLQSFLSLQLIFSTIGILFSSYSLYYQAVKAKIWCTLCLGVVGIFLLEAITIFFYFSNYDFFFEVSSIIKPLIGFLIPISFLLIFKNAALKAQESTVLQKEITRLKTNPQIFEALMANQRQMHEIPNDLPRLSLGNSNAQHTITFVSNPLCSPCAKMHLKIEELLGHDKNIKCEVLFLSNPNRDDVGGQFVRKVFSLPKELQEKALHKWYERNDKNFEIWNSNYENFDEKPGLSNIQVAHNYWANEAQVTATPTLFLNGILLPDAIKIEDLSLQLSHTSLIAISDGFANHQL